MGAERERMADVYNIRNQLHIGNFQQVVTDASVFNPKGDQAAKVECDVLLHRAYIGMGNHFLVLQKDVSNSPVSLQAVKVLAEYMQSSDVAGASAQLDAWMGDPSTASDPTMLVVGAMIHNREGNYEEALKYVHNPGTSLEMMATLVYTYLQMDRIDLAEKQFKTMQQNDDDATLTNLASAWLNLAKGGDKIQRALFTFTDLAEKYGTSVSLLNGMAACHMSQGEFEDAEKLLQEALSKNPNDVDSLINTVVCLQHNRTSEDLAMSTMSQLRTLHPTHPFVKNMANLEDSFARISA